MAEVYLTTTTEARRGSKEIVLREKEPDRYGAGRPKSTEIYASKQRRMDMTK